MGAIFRDAEKHIADLGNSIVLEIGSDRYEGSTEYFSNLAQQHGVAFHSVDIVNDAQRRLGHLPVHWHTQPGSEWCQTVLPTMGVEVGCVYLDNFDYNWDVKQPPQDWVKERQMFYAQTVGVEMTNQNSQIEHLRQILAIYPYLADSAVVVCDDTYTYNDCWIGKSGAVVIYLLANGFELVSHIREPKDLGVILKRTKNTQGNV
jgi:hypothetical protein